MGVIYLLEVLCLFVNVAHVSGNRTEYCREPVRLNMSDEGRRLCETTLSNGRLEFDNSMFKSTIPAFIQ